MNRKQCFQLVVTAVVLSVVLGWMGFAQDAQRDRSGGGIFPPKVLEKQDPIYSAEAREKKIEGAVLLGAVVGTDGSAHNVHVLRGLGYGLDEKAIEAIQKWKFQPATLNGEAIPVELKFVVSFHLK